MSKMIRVDGSVIEVSSLRSALHTLSQAKSHGAEVLFLGVVREMNLGRRVEAVAYDAFQPLAEKTLAEITEEAKLKFNQDLRSVIFHRTGKLRVGEVSIGIAVSSCHRDEAYEASRFIIEEIKIRAPIWKKEYYVDGESEWLKGHALCSHGKKAHQESSPPFSSVTE